MLKFALFFPLNTGSSYLSKMSRKFKGTAVPLTAPERLLPTESCGIDLREARSMNRPTRDFGDDRPRRDFGDDRGPRRDFGDDRGPRRDFGDDRGPRRDFGDSRPPRREMGSEERFPRRFDRDGDDGPRRAFSRRTEDSGTGPAGESDDDWRAGPSRTATAPRRFGGDSSDMPERRPSRREEDTAADLEDDWRAGAAARPSAFTDRRTSKREDDESAPRRFGSRREDEESAPVRRFSSRKVEEPATKADEEDDWRRAAPREEPVNRDRIERTRSARPATKADEEDDWRAVRSAAPRRESPVRETPSKLERRRSDDKKTPSTVQPKKAVVIVEEEKWSDDEEEQVPEAQEAKPDMEKISKFATKVGQYIGASKTEDVVKKIEAISKKIPVNFDKPELRSLEPMRAVLRLILDQSMLTSSDEILRVVGLIAPILLCLEDQFELNGGSVEEYQLNLIEECQRFVASIGCPRISPEEALVELIWLALYEQSVVCEEIFSKWLESDAFDSPHKSTTLFQTEAFRAWVYEFELPGVEASAKKTTQEADGKDEWSSDDDSDIEALVPKRLTAVNLRAGPIAPIRR